MVSCLLLRAGNFLLRGEICHFLSVMLPKSKYILRLSYFRRKVFQTPMDILFSWKIQLPLSLWKQLSSDHFTDEISWEFSLHWNALETLVIVFNSNSSSVGVWTLPFENALTLCPKYSLLNSGDATIRDEAIRERNTIFTQWLKARSSILNAFRNLNRIKANI